jgi:hypothetical protein
VRVTRPREHRPPARARSLHTPGSHLVPPTLLSGCVDSMLWRCTGVGARALSLSVCVIGSLCPGVRTHCDPIMCAQLGEFEAALAEMLPGLRPSLFHEVALSVSAAPPPTPPAGVSGPLVEALWSPFARGCQRSRRPPRPNHTPQSNAPRARAGAGAGHPGNGGLRRLRRRAVRHALAPPPRPAHHQDVRPE